ncbi:uncharacterized protein AMSG_11105 [Thecamonas trahens ATCC 50062]|uniref:RIC1 C-terminal alpha solenoid region domain-containing protein n=1 Tax=Thecamonas trahens ATCC 50062 TaxID=461836 RepID=A0A0L0DT89_THETB|nr:hypothetical protein AMSG_11105 [Thecamonas trahens ATCC 50062]KNC55442.1 hypothetical protein AMSG_11105 [Thecamonas trahens ATCC 50062]|eukprot:XP_013752979.1 hypothetical protein AMSG_11105 [Thecamonas trahens ATCC 50062]
MSRNCSLAMWTYVPRATPGTRLILRSSNTSPVVATCTTLSASAGFVAHADGSLVQWLSRPQPEACVAKAAAPPDTLPPLSAMAADWSGSHLAFVHAHPPRLALCRLASAGPAALAITETHGADLGPGAPLLAATRHRVVAAAGSTAVCTPWELLEGDPDAPAVVVELDAPITALAAADDGDDRDALWVLAVTSYGSARVVRYDMASTGVETASIPGTDAVAGALLPRHGAVVVLTASGALSVFAATRRRSSAGLLLRHLASIDLVAALDLDDPAAAVVVSGAVVAAPRGDAVGITVTLSDHTRALLTWSYASAAPARIDARTAALAPDTASIGWFARGFALLAASPAELHKYDLMQSNVRERALTLVSESGLVVYKAFVEEALEEDVGPRSALLLNPCVAYPPTYLEDYNAPVVGWAWSPSALHGVVWAGAGFTVYDVRTAKWHLIGSRATERDLAVIAVVWLDDSRFAVAAYSRAAASYLVVPFSLTSPLAVPTPIPAPLLFPTRIARLAASPGGGLLAVLDASGSLRLLVRASPPSDSPYLALSRIELGEAGTGSLVAASPALSLHLLPDRDDAAALLFVHRGRLGLVTLDTARCAASAPVWIASDVGTFVAAPAPADLGLVVLTTSPRGVSGLALNTAHSAFGRAPALSMWMADLARSGPEQSLWSSRYAPTLALDAASGTIAAFDPTLFSSAGSDGYERALRSHTVVAHYILHCLARGSDLPTLLAFARSVATASQVSAGVTGLAERVLHAATASEANDLLESSMAFVEYLGEEVFLAAAVGVVRKSDISFWPWMFSVFGEPAELVARALALGDLDSGVNLLIVLLDASPDELQLDSFANVLEAVLGAQRHDLLPPILRFVASLADAPPGPTTPSVARAAPSVQPRSGKRTIRVKVKKVRRVRVRKHPKVVVITAEVVGDAIVAAVAACDVGTAAQTLAALAGAWTTPRLAPLLQKLLARVDMAVQELVGDQSIDEVARLLAAAPRSSADGSTFLPLLSLTLLSPASRTLAAAWERVADKLKA